MAKMNQVGDYYVETEPNPMYHRIFNAAGITVGMAPDLARANTIADALNGTEVKTALAHAQQARQVIALLIAGGFVTSEKVDQAFEIVEHYPQNEREINDFEGMARDLKGGEPTEIEQLRRWKAEAMEVMPDFQKIGELLSVPIGTSVHLAIIPGIEKLLNERDELIARLNRLETATAGTEPITAFDRGTIHMRRTGDRGERMEVTGFTPAPAAGKEQGSEAEARAISILIAEGILTTHQLTIALEAGRMGLIPSELTDEMRRQLHAPLSAPAAGEEAEAMQLLKDYEQWEADLIADNAFWWPHAPKDAISGKTYEKMLELQQRRNEIMRRASLSVPPAPKCTCRYPNFNPMTDRCLICGKPYSTEPTAPKDLRDALNFGHPYNIFNVLQRLTKAAEYLLHKKDYDGPDYEEIGHSVVQAKAIHEKLFSYFDTATQPPAHTVGAAAPTENGEEAAEARDERWERRLLGLKEYLDNGFQALGFANWATKTESILHLLKMDILSDIAAASPQSEAPNNTDSDTLKNAGPEVTMINPVGGDDYEPDVDRHDLAPSPARNPYTVGTPEWMQWEAVNGKPPVSEAEAQSLDLFNDGGGDEHADTSRYSSSSPFSGNEGSGDVPDSGGNWNVVGNPYPMDSLEWRAWEDERRMIDRDSESWNEGPQSNA